MSKRDDSGFGFATVALLATVAALVVIPSCRSHAHGHHDDGCCPPPPSCRETYHSHHTHHSCETVRPCYRDSSCHTHTIHTHSTISDRLSHVFGRCHERCCD
ncbi:MAG: hypothetical protein J6U64_02770 [Alphaproteobacteria bacterium]|nr:hypothetical protein [Alphaproteobacteria bacterium]